MVKKNKTKNHFCLFSAIHSSTPDAPVDLPGTEGGERAVARGPTGDVHGPQRNEGWPWSGEHQFILYPKAVFRMP